MIEWTVKAPGSIMLMGEHAVLHGQPAMVAAVDACVEVRLTPRSDIGLVIDCAFGEYTTTIDKLSAPAPFDVVVNAVAAFGSSLTHGFDVHIDSHQMPTAKGIGSSTAVVVAITAALQLCLQGKIDFDQCFDISLASVRRHQGSCSGADVAASVYGGVLLYQQRAQRPLIEGLGWQPEWVLLYCGEKMPTAKVVAKVQDNFKNNADELDRLYARIGVCVKSASEALKNKRFADFYQAVGCNQQCMAEMGLVHEPLQDVLDFFRQQSGVSAEKVSGAGLGDCAIGFGRLNDGVDCPFEQVAVSPNQQGVVHVSTDA